MEKIKPRKVSIAAQNDSVSLNMERNMSKERWEGILECKENFLHNENADPRTCVHMNQEVAASWLRSRKMKVDPYNQPIDRSLSPKEYQKILAKNSRLIEITKRLITIFKEMVISANYCLELIDINGVYLLREGELILPSFALEGTIFNEDTMGTNAHTLSMLLQRPVQLIGPEHYCVDLHDILASAAPITGESGEVIASLVLSQPLLERPWLNSHLNLRSHTLGLITSIAAAIEAQIKLKKSYEQLEIVNNDLTVAHDTLEATLSFIDEGIITIDRTGKIIHINREGIRILKMRSDETHSRNISEFLVSQSRLMTLVESGKNVDIEETICIGKDEQPYLISILPVLNQSTKQTNVAVLRLNHAEKINALVTSRSGATASFHFEDIIGESKALKKAIDTGKRFAITSENILLIGESGTGKELFAQAIHNKHRPQGPFMAVNCAAMPRNLIESELFGYEGGSFTGAERSGRPGKIELANGGTLFLDEIGDMPFELQAVLLRVLEDKQVMRVGGQRHKKVDFRLVAASNKDIYGMVKEKLFREDLYYRLSVLSITLPPLRKRENDTEILSRYFIDGYCKKMGWKIPEISAEALKLIKENGWPGNVRQLENAINYAVITAQDGIIETKNLPDSVILDSGSAQFNEIANSGGQGEEGLSLKNLEKSAIDLALVLSHNSIPRAADLLDISKATLYRKIKEYKDQQ